MKFYIYEIKNLKTNMYYIGASTDPETRFRNHKTKIKSGLCGAHPEIDKRDLAMRILEEVDFDTRSEAYKYEAKVTKEYIDKGYNLYNIKMGSNHTEEEKKAIGDRHRGLKLSDEAKAKLSKALKGRKMPPEVIERYRRLYSGKNNPMYGRKGPDHPAWKGGCRQKQYNARYYHRGEPVPPDVKARQQAGARKYFDTHKGIRAGKNNANYGKKISKEQKRRMTEGLKRAFGDLRGSNNPFYGQKHSEEAKAKMKKAWIYRRLVNEQKKKDSLIETEGGPLIVAVNGEDE